MTALESAEFFHNNIPPSRNGVTPKAPKETGGFLKKQFLKT